MSPYATRLQLHRVADACRKGDRDAAAARLAWLSDDVRRTLGRRLDSFSLSTLRAWRFIPARTAEPGGLG